MGTALDWFASYLLYREYFVKIDSCVSSTKLINVGLPQDNTLGPILFLVYVNGLPNVSSLQQPILFADDTTVSVSETVRNGYSEKSWIHKINNEFYIIQQWSIYNRLSINADKSELLFN